MSPLPVVTQANVQEIVALSPGHPVYKVTLRGGAQFVAKADRRGNMGAVASDIAKFDAQLMGQVSKNTDIEIMSATEVGALFMCLGAVTPASAKASFKANATDVGNFWYKMPLLNVTTVQDMLDEDEAELLRRVFKDIRSLGKLGKIAAVDLFIGNTDRFDGEGNLSNLGNIFFSKKKVGLMRKTQFTPIGLDFWDGFKDDMNLTLTMSHWDQLATRPGVGVALAKDIRQLFESRIAVLGDYNLMLDFADHTINSANDEVRRAGVRDIDVTKGKYKVAMAKGMQAGARAIKDHLTTMMKKKGMGGVPAGAVYRAQLLRWI